ncbi:helix-turn-helix transcriptional regulator [Levilactobacillus suantsaii]|uniref:Transcriptional regulator n=1 Tax=Levilactobacillus suantsaii TaxID=2292255 RepID=A0A4Q0VFZ2_9LACO|nr:helix-turn-helix transcriptional regulator [Levilactobacillus suantsaii]QMU08473.1 helix-turn-helix transcriptional regulator [Levilactobacillus suantsaii]RXI76443.1 transcriptional regulator [Levilactobacillus suantsaii]
MNNLVAHYRKKNGLTQLQVANMVNVTSRTIISIEKGTYKPSLILAYKLAKVFDTDVETMFKLEEYLGGLHEK